MPDASERFNTIANRFATSEVHKDSPTIALLHQILLEAQSPRKEICDIACGSGNMGLSFEKYVTRLVGVDPAPTMLEEFQKQAQAKGIKVDLIRAFAEELPLESEQFDVAVTRLAPHHFNNIQKAINEMARIVKPHGYVAVIDLQGEENAEADAFNHQLEVLHDPLMFEVTRHINGKCFCTMRDWKWSHNIPINGSRLVAWLSSAGVK